MAHITFVDLDGNPVWSRGDPNDPPVTVRIVPRGLFLKDDGYAALEDFPEPETPAEEALPVADLPKLPERPKRVELTRADLWQMRIDKTGDVSAKQALRIAMLMDVEGMNRDEAALQAMMEYSDAEE